MLGFAGESRDVILCTVVCVEPAVPEDSAAAGRCPALIDDAVLEGTLREAPPPSLWVQAILLSAERPAATLGIGAVVVLAVIAWVLARRPRPKW
jgi:hypothetical protein